MIWDRRTYRDTDFGLVDGESFEPVVAAQSDDFDLSQPHIMTVLGPIAPDQLGTCQAFEHILCDPVSLSRQDPDCRLDRIDLACEELEAFISVGGRSMVDASTIDYGRDLAGLRAVAQRLPVNIIAAAGRQSHSHAVHMSNALDQGAIEREILADVSADAKPGIIAVGTSLNLITGVERVAAQACATVASVIGFPVFIHLEAGTMAHEAIDIVEAAAVNPTRLILGSLDQRLDLDFLRSIAARGAWISFEHVGKTGYGGDAAKAGMLMRLAEAGFEDRLLISQGLSRKSDLVAYGGTPGWTYLLERFTLELMDAGASAQFVRKLLIDNPANALTIHP